MALGIAVATIAGHAFKVARANPIKALRIDRQLIGLLNSVKQMNAASEGILIGLLKIAAPAE